MNLRFTVPQSFHLHDIDPTTLTPLPTSFKHGRYSVTLSFLGGEIEEATWVTESNVQYRWFRRPNGIQINVTDENTSGGMLAHLVTQEKKALTLILELTTRVVRVIRNVGNVPAVAETVSRDEDTRKQLLGLKAETSVDGQIWRPLVSPFTTQERIVLGLLFIGNHAPPTGFDRVGWLWMYYWCRIEEVLEEGRDVSPEDEFLTNTFGHLNANNLRLALVEAVIGLEIVLSGYLKARLAIIESVPARRIKSSWTASVPIGFRHVFTDRRS